MPQPPDQRREPRFTYVHKVTVQKDHIFARGFTVDISNHGIQVTVNGRLDEVGGYLVRFYMQRDQGLLTPKTIFQCNGHVRWIYYQAALEKSTIGIEFDAPLVKGDVGETATCAEGDYCYIHIYHASAEPVPEA